MVLSILHLSDLHRDPEHEITSDALIHSLERDRDRYTEEEAPAIESPHLIVVSGDVVRGIRPDSPDPIADILGQYEQAEYFLTELAQRFVGGDKNKIILVPGNHDVSAHHFMTSLRHLEFDRNDPSERQVIQRLFAPTSILRWSWDALELFEIVDFDEYQRRLEPFCSFYSRFYDGARSLSLDPADQFDVFDYPEFKIAAVALSSCYNNDLFNKQGAIHPDSIVRASRELLDWKYHDRLRIAVWHHNTSGSPTQSDYMDPDVLQFLIDSGFSIGFHGHQHKPQFIDERFKLGGESKITLVSAGTLCGGDGCP